MGGLGGFAVCSFQFFSLSDPGRFLLLISMVLPKVTGTEPQPAKDDSPMAASRRRYQTPDLQSTVHTSIPSSTTSLLPPSHDASSNTTPSPRDLSLDLTSIAARPETIPNNILPVGWNTPQDLSNGGGSAQSVPNRNRHSKPIPPPGGSARGSNLSRRGSARGSSARGARNIRKGSSSARRPSTMSAQSDAAPPPQRYQKWMNKSILEIRRANERVTNPYSPLYKRAKNKRRSDEIDDDEPARYVHPDHMDMSNITDRLHDQLSIAGLEKESTLMCKTKEKNCELLMMRCNKLITQATKKAKQLKWFTKETIRLHRIMGENKKLSDEAENSPEVVAIKQKLKNTTHAANREESYTYVMRLLVNRAKYPLKTSTKRLGELKKEIIKANHELKNLKSRQHRLNDKRDLTLLEKNDLEKQCEDLYNIYLNKIKTLNNVEKARQNNFEQGKKQEEERLALKAVLNGDRGIEAENILKKGLLRGVMKGKAVTARAHILKQENDIVIKAFDKMMKVAADTNLDSIIVKFIDREIKTKELDNNLKHLTTRLENAKIRNDELYHDLENIQLEYSNPANDRRLQHQSDDMEVKLHKLNLENESLGSKALNVKIHLQRVKECFQGMIVDLKSAHVHKKKEEEVQQAQTEKEGENNSDKGDASMSRIKSKSTTNTNTLDEDWPYPTVPTSPISIVEPSKRKNHNIGRLKIVDYEELKILLHHVMALMKQTLNGLNKTERYAYLHHHTPEVTHFMSGAAALHRANQKGLVHKVSRGNYRVATALTPDQEILLHNMVEHSLAHKKHGNISTAIQNMVVRKSDEARKSLAVKKEEQQQNGLHRQHSPNSKKKKSMALQTSWFDDDDENAEEHADRHHQKMLQHSMTTEVADRSQLKKLSQMLVYRKQKIINSSSNNGGGGSTTKKKKSGRRVSIVKKSKSPSKKKKSKRVSMKSGGGGRKSGPSSVFITQQSGTGSPDKMGTGSLERFEKQVNKAALVA